MKLNASGRARWVGKAKHPVATVDDGCTTAIARSFVVVNLRTVTLTALCGLLLFAAGIPTGSAAQAPARHLTIGCSMWGTISFSAWGQRGMEREAQADGVTLDYVSANQDVPTQLKQIDGFIAKHDDAIIIGAVNSETLTFEIAKARAAHIPVFGLNMTIDSPGLSAHIGADDVAAGRAEMQAVVDALKGSGNVVVVQGPIGSSAVVDRTHGIMQVADQNPGIHVLSARGTHNWGRDEAGGLMKTWFERYGNQVQAVVGENDDLALGGLDGFSAANIRSAPASGVDGNKNGLQSIQQGHMIETNLQNAALEFAEALHVAVMSLHGQPVKPKYLMQMPKVTHDNVDHYYNDIFADPDKFLAGLPSLVDRNLQSGNYGDE
jgi:ribose transport system substrate-binding protein